MFEIELTFCIKVDFALNNQQRLMCHKTQTTKLSILLFSYKLNQASWLGMQNTPTAFLQRGKTSPTTSVLDIILNYPVLGNVEYPFIAIGLRSILIQRGRTRKGSIYCSNRTVYPFKLHANKMAFAKLTLEIELFNHLPVWKQMTKILY